MIQYERRRLELVSYFEAVRHAQQVQVDEIPLPSSGNQVYTGIYNVPYSTWVFITLP